MRYAVVDTGSNTIRMSIYECENNNFNEIFTEAVFANLASYIEDNCLKDDGISVCSEAIIEHNKKAAEYGADEFRVFATAAIRNVKNTDEVVKNVKKNTGVDLEILSGKDEGELSFLGACDDFPIDDGVMADVGGGSSEIIVFRDKKHGEINSVPLGSLSAYKKFVSGDIPTTNELQSIKAEVKGYLDKFTYNFDFKSENLCLVGGGVRAAKELSRVLLNNEDLDVDGINRMIDLLLCGSETEEVLEKIVPKRKLTIIPSLAIYSAIATYFGAKKIYVSDKGIKEGYLIKYLIH